VAGSWLRIRVRRGRDKGRPARRLPPYGADDRVSVVQVRVELPDFGEEVVEGVLVGFFVLHAGGQELDQVRIG
jgi:hypothetical protein